MYRPRNLSDRQHKQSCHEDTSDHTLKKAAQLDPCGLTTHGWTDPQVSLCARKSATPHQWVGKFLNNCLGGTLDSSLWLGCGDPQRAAYPITQFLASHSFWWGPSPKGRSSLWGMGRVKEVAGWSWLWPFGENEEDAGRTSKQQADLEKNTNTTGPKRCHRLLSWVLLLSPILA